MAKLIDTIGHRAKIGAVIPGTNTIVQPEYDAFRPDGVTNHITRIPNKPRPTDYEGYLNTLKRGPIGTEDALDVISLCEPDAILLGHSIDSWYVGVEGATKMEAEYKARTGVPVLVPSLALDEALKAVGCGKRLAVLTPYQTPGDEAVDFFLKQAGYEVVRLIGLKCPSPIAIACVTEDEIRDSLKALDGPDVDAIVQAGTNLAMARLAAEAELMMKKPILAVNTVTYWHGLRTLGIKDQMDGFGRLMAEH